MTQNQHFRTREGDAVNSCLCHSCFTAKCFVYESVIQDIQQNYRYFRAHVEHLRGNMQASYALQEEAVAAGQEICSDYASIQGQPDFDVLDELRAYLVSNGFQFRVLSILELQRIMRQ